MSDTDSSTVFVDSARAALILGLSPQTLANWRTLGSGPPFCKLGRRTLYHRADLEKWALARRRTSTSSAPEAA